MFEKLKEYALYIILGLIALGALAYAYLNTTNSKKGAEIEEANLDAMVASMSRSDKLKKSSTIANDLLNANGGKTVGKYKIDDSKVSYVIGENYSEIFDNKQMLDITSSVSDVEDGQLRTILIAQPATKVNGEDVDVVNLNRDSSLQIGENTISRGNLDQVADELKGYNVGAIGYTTFSTEQEAKDFRDTYFPSYEIYQLGTTGTFAILTEYNQGNNGNITEKIDTTSNIEGLGGTQEQANTTFHSLEDYDWENINQSITFTPWGYGPIFDPTGTKIYDGDLTSHKIRYGTLTTPYDLNTLTNTGYIELTCSPLRSGNAIIQFNGNGTKFFRNCKDQMFEYSLTTPYDISEYSFVRTIDIPGSRYFSFSSDGTYFFTHNELADGGIAQYRLTTPYDLTTAIFMEGLIVADGIETGGWSFDSTGRNLIIGMYGNSTVYRYELSTPWLLSTAILKESKNLGYRMFSIYQVKYQGNDYLFAGRARTSNKNRFTLKDTD